MWYGHRFVGIFIVVVVKGVFCVVRRQAGNFVKEYKFTSVFLYKIIF